VATQNITDPSLGPGVLDVLGRGLKPRAALDEVLSATPFAAYRQLLAIGNDGPPAIHSGAHGLGVVNAAVGANAAAAGNLLASPAVPAAMIAAFEAANGHFGDCLLQALRAGLDTGGEAGPVHSAGLLIVRDVSWPIVDLRVDWTDEDPVAALGTIWRLYAPQIDDYVRRAIDPGRAPSYGVPGDL
jgi:uncharacterized Ntn-hydrolase superfamily protein